MTSLLSTLQAGVLTLTLNCPERANAFNVGLIGELQEAFTKAEKNSHVRVIVLTGSGKAFSAGQDISEMKGGGEISYREHLEKTYNPLILQIRRIEKPVIAGINGPCAGAAQELHWLATYALPPMRLNSLSALAVSDLFPILAVSLLLPALIGLGHAEEFYFSNAPISAQQALEWGLINRVFAATSFVQETLAFAMQLAAGPVGTFGLAKQAFNRAMLSNLEDVLNSEADLQEIAGKRAEHKEGVAAFLEKRKPKYI